jgi:beta-glucanase (GH16 family)
MPLLCAWIIAVVLLLRSAEVNAAGWKMVWSDEFDRDGLPDRKKWRYEKGIIRNNEAQYYTKKRLENARVENGLLVIEARKEQVLVPNGQQISNYTSASLTTFRKASWTYGRIEVRAKLPQGRGVWPAIWMLGVNVPWRPWPACGEIDIMEFVGHDPTHIYGTRHYRANGQHASDGGNVEINAPYDDFHIYAIEWFSDRIDFFVDETKYYSSPIDIAGKGYRNPFRKRQYLIINLALGGTLGGVIDDPMLPQDFLIDYVRVFKQADE